jgi:MoaA/NifB/PqqE/SkfB family radical SAM enzyme
MCANEPAFGRAPSGRYRLKGQIKRFESYLSGFSGAYDKNSGNRAALNLTGGEPALNPDLLKLLAYFRRRSAGRELTLLSNGRRFADAGFAGAALKAAGAPFVAAVSMHGSTAARHDAVSGVRGSFDATMAGLRNILTLKRPGQALEIRLVLHRRNIKDLKNLLSLLLREFSGFKGWRVVAMHYELEGRALKDPSLALRLKTSSAAVNSCAGLIRRFKEFRLYHFPLCLLKKELRPLAWVTLPPEDRFYAAACAGCSLRSGCVGLMARYNARFGSGELKAI